MVLLFYSQAKGKWFLDQRLHSTLQTPTPHPCMSGFPSDSPSGTEKCQRSTGLLPFVTSLSCRSAKLPCGLSQPLCAHLSSPRCRRSIQGRQSSAWPLWLALHPGLFKSSKPPKSFINAKTRGDLMDKGDHLIEFETNRHASE